MRVTGTVREADGAWLRYDYGSTPVTSGPDRPEAFTMWRYAPLLPIGDGPVRFPLPVGGTPLLSVPGLRAATGLPWLWAKDETRNPTASNKDRATALVIEDGLRRGLDTVATASTGNAAISTAAGAAAAGIRAVIFVSTDCQPDKLTLMAQAGAWVFRVPQGYAAAVDLSRAAAARFGWMDRNTGANPLTLEAKKTVALEVWEQLGRIVPDVIVVPVGDGPTLVALDKGFGELVACGLTGTRPRLIGVQAQRCQPLVHAWRGASAASAELNPSATAADGIAVLRPAIGGAVLAAIERTAGAMVAVSERALAEAVEALAARAGVGAEPTGAASLAGALAARESGLLDDGESVVLLVTGRQAMAAGRPPATDRVATVRTLDDVARVLATAS